MRSLEQYSAESTRVLAAKYADGLRTALILLPQEENLETARCFIAPRSIPKAPRTKKSFYIRRKGRHSLSGGHSQQDKGATCQGDVQKPSPTIALIQKKHPGRNGEDGAAPSHSDPKHQSGSRPSSQASISMRAMDTLPGISGKWSRLNHPPLAISLRCKCNSPST